MATANSDGFQPLYVRYQRARRGHLRAGDHVEDCTLLTIDGEATTLQDATSKADISCMVAGSYS